MDDNVDAANTLSYLLRMHGCKTAVAFGGETAVRTAQLLQPNLAIIDLMLPGIDGYEVLRRVREHCTVRPWAVALTGNWDAQCNERCRQAGFDRFIEKPMPPALLPELLRECQQHMGKPLPTPG